MLIQALNKINDMVVKARPRAEKIDDFIEDQLEIMKIKLHDMQEKNRRGR